jgi:hypothetical protein
MVNVTTKISREDMIAAQLADPRNKKTHWRNRKKGQVMVLSIIERMDKLIGSIVRNAYVRYAHAADRALDVEDLLAHVRCELVLAIYRYKSNGVWMTNPKGVKRFVSYNPLNYLLGVVHIVLRNVHNKRNRKKRIPLDKLVSIDTPSTSGDGQRTLGDTLVAGDHVPQNDEHKVERTPEEDGRVFPLGKGQQAPSLWKGEESLINRIDVEQMFSELKTETVRVNIAGQSKKIILHDIIRSILDGGSVASTAREQGVPRHVMRAIIREKIVPTLEEV